jgi:MoaA/NifB/PqqE/SkfB family radical SAM enzyme
MAFKPRKRLVNKSIIPAKWFSNTFKTQDRLTSINIEISGRCNLSCEHCSYQKWYRDQGLMSFETIKKLQNIFPILKEVYLAGNGEPLLNQNIIETIQFIKAVNPDIFLGFVTNGTLLSEELAQEFVVYGVNKISVSLDGASRETYQLIRKGAQFEEIINNIKRLVKQREQLKKKDSLELGIITVINKLNAQEMPQLLALSHDLHIDSITINGLEPHTDSMAQQVMYNIHENQDYQMLFDQLEQMAKQYHMKLELPSLTLLPYSKCILNSCGINWKGEVHPCFPLSYKRPFYYFGHQMHHPKLIFGNIQEQDLFSIWNSSEYRNFRRRLRQEKFPDFCKYCLVMHGVICPIDRVSATG